MRFAIDAHAVGSRLTGNEVYIRNLLSEFAKLDDENEFLAYISQPDAYYQAPGRFQKSWVSANPYRRLGLDLPARLRRDRPALIHVQYTAPLGCRAPVVATIHDVSFLECPQYFRPARALQLRLTVGRTVATAACILTPSEFSRQAILEHYQIDPGIVIAIPNGVSAAFRPVNREAAARQIAHTFDIHDPFVLTVGDLQPRKNHLGLLLAFESVVRARPGLRHHLVLAGQETWWSAEVHRAVERSPVRDRVHFTGFVTDEDLIQLYGACDVFAFPSFYEGFGLPILEAMACGRAVVCSGTTAMPEVASGAALLVDPHSGGQMAQALADVLLDSRLRLRLERAGPRRARSMSWERAARLTLDAYYQVAGAPARHHEDCTGGGPGSSFTGGVPALHHQLAERLECGRSDPTLRTGHRPVGLRNEH
jgi:glycosyltransferase involved in cell wall biosynthesis